MAKEIIDRFHQFALTEKERKTVSFESSDVLSSIKECEVSLLGKVISDKRVNLQGVKNTMYVAWGNPAGLQVKEIGWNFFQFKFKDKEKMEKVQVWNIPLHWMSTDVGHKIENALGGMVDIVIPENGSKEGQYMRLKVRINITKPLPRGHNDKTCTQRAKDIQEGKAKVDQFG